MATEVVTSGRMRRGKLQVSLTPAFARALTTFKDGPVTIRIARMRASRSQQQNRLYWGVYVESLSQHTGYAPDDIHELLKAKFLPKTLAVCDGNGELVGEYVLGGSTVKLDVGAFGAYLDAIKAWAVTLGCVFPALEDVA